MQMGRTNTVRYLKKSSCLGILRDRVFRFQPSAMKRNRIKLSPTRSIALHSRPPLERMMRMHERLKAGRYPNCRKLADELEVSSKTVQRDIDFMRYRLGLPIEYDQLHFGFYYTEPVASFPNIEISEGELIALYIGQKALTQYKGTSFEAPLSTAFRKITDGLRDTISMTWSDLDSAVSFRSTGRSTTDVHLFEELSHAVFKQLEIRFDYKKPDAARYEQRYVQPYHLGCVENLWYLFAFDVDRAAGAHVRSSQDPQRARKQKTSSGALSISRLGNSSAKALVFLRSQAKPNTRSGSPSTPSPPPGSRNVNGIRRKRPNSCETAELSSR